ncbi:hypothetical protein GGX14DRAFT_579830 [Mycena pura]|uniref:Uncharacterized protein n=1 Tax=Mycena pura TaxID=153505 RepID=A0AAD6UUA9_9AGAR|nr:hypothetical protein GGX14DRAFT_579830 [Mycena pura]
MAHAARALPCGATAAYWPNTAAWAEFCVGEAAVYGARQGRREWVAELVAYARVAGVRAQRGGEAVSRRTRRAAGGAQPALEAGSTRGSDGDAMLLCNLDMFLLEELPHCACSGKWLVTRSGCDEGM